MSTTARMLQTAVLAHPDLAAVKSHQQGAWSSGDYALVGTTLQKALKRGAPAGLTPVAIRSDRNRQCKLKF